MDDEQSDQRSQQRVSDESGGIAGSSPDPHRPEKAVERDYELVEFRVPYFQVFDLGDGSDSETYEEAQKQYEQILQNIEEGIFERISSTGVWGVDGHYRVQIHYYEVHVDRILKEEEGTDYGTDVEDDDVTKERSEEERTGEHQGAVVAENSLPTKR